MLDLLSQIANYRKLLAVIMPLFIVGWIGLPRFAKLDDDLMATSLGLWLGGIVLHGASIQLQRPQLSGTVAASSARRC